jgi:murein DD-endopeptidase MepM/ murein hydrolase activator NlpD
MRGQVPPGTEVRLDGRAIRVAADGLFVFGFGRDAKPDHRLTLRLPDGSRQERAVSVAKRSYAIQRIDGLAPRMVTPSAAALVRIRRENAWIAAARKRDSPEPHFATGFAWPLRGIVTGVYGSQRILNGEPRRPHYGVDIAAPTGEPVLSPAAGEVALAEADLYFTVGASGRATGPHLDWRVNWFRERLDPARLVPPMPSQ